MGIAVKRCLICKHKMARGWFIESNGVCRLCRRDLVPPHIPEVQKEKYILEVVKKLTQKQI